MVLHHSPSATPGAAALGVAARPPRPLLKPPLPGVVAAAAVPLSMDNAGVLGGRGLRAARVGLARSRIPIILSVSIK